MKQTGLQAFGTLALAALVASCGGIDKMKEAAKQIQYKVDPEVLEAHQGKVAMAFTANVPAKMWDKKVVAEITPILTYNGGQDNYPTITVQGEAVQGNGQVVSFTNGGSIKYPKQEIDFNDKQRVSDLIVKIKFTRGSKSIEVTSQELDMDPLAKGVIATSTLVGDQPGKMASSKDKYQKSTTEEKVAEILFLVNKFDIRSGELKKDEVKALNEYIKTLNEDEKKSIKSIAISAYASPEGAVDLNTKLAGNRESSAKTYVDKTLKTAKVEGETNVVANNTPEDWEGFKKAIENSEIQDKELILRVLSLYSDPDQREKEIRNLAAVYKVLAKDVLPALRRSTITVKGELVGRTDDEMKAASLDDLSVEELLYLANLYEGNDAAKQKAALEKAATKYNDARAKNNLGVIAFNEGKVDEAKAQFESVADAGLPEVMNNLGACALAKGDLNEAKEKLGQAAGAGAELNENLGIASLLEGDYEKAESYMGNSTTNNSALVKILLGKYDAALSTLNANSEESGLKYYLKAIANARKNDKNTALENLRKATELEAKWKSYAKTDMEFGKFFNDGTFKSIVE